MSNIALAWVVKPPQLRGEHGPNLDLIPSRNPYQNPTIDRTDARAQGIRRLLKGLQNARPPNIQSVRQILNASVRLSVPVPARAATFADVFAAALVKR